MTTTGRGRWPLFFRWVGVATTAGVSTVLLLDERPSSADRVFLIATAAVAVGLALIAGINRPRLADTIAASITAVMAIATYAFGGLFFLVCALVYVVAATIDSWPHQLVRSVRIIVAVTSSLGLLAFGASAGGLLFCAPLLVPLLVWAARTSPPQVRMVYAVLAGILAVFAIAVLGHVVALRAVV